MKYLRKWGWMESLMKKKITIYFKDRDLENLCSHQWGPLSLDKKEHDEVIDIIYAK